MKYSTLEESWNIGTHAFGFLASIPLTIFLLNKSEDVSEIIASLVFGMSMLILYLASTLYHSAKNEDLRLKLRIMDHAAIFILIAGTYTPICLISLWKSSGPVLLIIIWSIAVLGIIFKLFFTGKYDRISTILYVAMGWMAIFVVKPLFEVFSTEALLWLMAGGLSYTIGAILYRQQRLHFNHAIFHVFVLAGSACHYVMIYCYVI